MFEQVFVDTRARTRRPAAVALSFAGQVVLIGTMVLLPLLRTEAIVPNPLLQILMPPRHGSETQAPAPETRSPKLRTPPAPASLMLLPRSIASCSKRIRNRPNSGATWRPFERWVGTARRPGPRSTGRAP